MDKLKTEIEELKAEVEKQKRLKKEIFSSVGPDAESDRLKGDIKKMDRLLAKFMDCSPGRPVATVIAAAEEAAASLKAKSKVDHPRISKLLDQVKMEKKRRRLRRS